jgi:type I restriction enzyme S subunit
MEVQPYREVMRGYTYFEEEDVLFAKITPSMENGKAAIARGLIDGLGFGSTEFHRLRPGDSIIPEWAYFFVRQSSFRREAATHFRGSVGQQRVPKEFLAQHLIPAPPRETQRRIVARIEGLFAELGAARHLHAALVHDAERLMDAVLAKSFHNPLEEMPQGWTAVSVSDICAKPQYGYTQSADESPVGPKFLRITDIQEGQVNWDTVPYCECSKEDIEKYELEPDDLVFARSGATTGKTFALV